MANRKLGKPTDQRVAMLRNLTTALIWNGKIVTTETRAKEVRSIAEKIITLAVKEYKNTDMVEKEVYNEKGQVSKEEKPQDQPSKLHARRQIMSYLYDIPEPKKEKETKKEYRDRTKGTNHAVVEKLFRELAKLDNAVTADFFFTVVKIGHTGNGGHADAVISAGKII